ncbi:MAG: PIN domain-containing protein [Bacteroidales bacterium]|jgi:predicted nucleic acid-binding protein|nr:PIN domain-containing protein [Bacteroidales bacterium]
MINVFLDIDVIVDYITDRKPFSDNAEKIFALIEQKKIEGHTSSLCFSNLYYLLRQQITRTKALDILKNLAELLNILKVDEDTILQALSSGFNDFEDAIQYYSVLEYKSIEMIVTRNIKDYKHSELPVMSPDSLLKTYARAISS